MKTLTKEQQKIVESNHALIYHILKERGLPIEQSDYYGGIDWYGTAALGLCRAAIEYDESRGAFSTYAYLCIKTEINHIYQHMHTKSAIPEEKLIFYGSGMEECVENENTGQIRRWSNTKQYVEEQTYKERTEKEVVHLKIVFEQWIKTLSSREQQMIYQIMNGDSYEKIGKTHGISKSRVGMILSQIWSKSKTTT